jgi:hypothetical protein
MADFGRVWQEAAANTMATTGIYVSGVVQASACLYHTDWGCPVGGEPTFTVEGSRNPQFCPDESVWVEAVLAVVSAVKQHYQQSTVTVEFSEVKQVYLQ